MDQALENLVPGIVKPYVGWIVGMDWPEADEDAIFKKVEALTNAAKGTDGVGASGDITFAAVKACMDGVAADSFGKYWDQFTKADPQFLPNLTKACNAAAEQLRSYGLDVEYTKYMILFSLILLAAQIAYFIAMAVPSFGASLSLIPGACAITQMGVRQLAVMLLRNILFATGIMEGMDAGIQGIQMLEGNRESWDLEKTKASIEGGVMTGIAFTGIAGLIGKAGGARLSSEGAQHLQFADLAGREKFAAFMTNSVGGHMLQSGAANMVGSVPMLAASGQLDLEHLAKAGTSGLIGAADGHLIKPTSTGGHGVPPGPGDLALPGAHPTITDARHPALDGPPPMEPGRILAGDYQGPSGDGGVLPVADHIPAGEHDTGTTPVSYDGAGQPVVPHQEGGQPHQTVAYDPGVQPATVPHTTLADAHTPVAGDGHGPIETGGRPAPPVQDAGAGRSDQAAQPRPGQEQPAVVPVAPADGQHAAPGDGGRGSTPPAQRADPAARPDQNTAARPDQNPAARPDQARGASPAGRPDQQGAVQQPGRGAEPPSGDGASARDGGGRGAGPSGRSPDVVVAPVDLGNAAGGHTPHGGAPRTVDQVRHAFREEFGETRYQRFVEEFGDRLRRLPEDSPWHEIYRRIPDELLAAVNAYTGGWHRDINLALRDGSAPVLAEHAAHIEALKTALDGLPPYDGIVHRGADLTPEQLARYQTGEVLREPAFTSSTAGLHSRLRGNTHFIIESHNGRDVGPLASRMGHEREVIFPPDTEFRVLGVDHKGPESIVYLREVHAPRADAEPTRPFRILADQGLPDVAGLAGTLPAGAHPDAPVSQPPRMEDYTRTGGRAGTNPGGRFVDPAGNSWYVKAPASDLHAKNEVLANDLYRLADVPVPRVDVIDLNGNFGDKNLGVRSGIVDGVQDLPARLDDPAYLGALRENFVVDAWLANWDTVGLAYDNVITGEHGPVRVDAGGALLYRALGDPKGHLFTDHVGEIDSLRDPSVNPQAARVFNDVTPAEIQAGVAKVRQVSEHQIREAVDRLEFPPHEAAVLKERLIARRQDLIDRFGGPDAPAVSSHPAGADHPAPVPPHDTTAGDHAVPGHDPLATYEEGLRDLGLHDLGPGFHSTPEDRQAIRDFFGETRFDDLLHDMRASQRWLDGGGLSDYRHADWAPVLDRIPIEDQVALHYYTMDPDLNTAMREGDLAGLEHWAPVIKGMTSALNEMPHHTGMVFRRIYLEPHQLHHLDVYQPGAVLREPAFISSSSEPKVRLGGNVEYVIESHTGRLVAPYVHARPHEHEVIFTPDRHFKVLDVEDLPGGGKRIYLRELVDVVEHVPPTLRAADPPVEPVFTLKPGSHEPLGAGTQHTAAPTSRIADLLSGAHDEPASPPATGHGQPTEHPPEAAPRSDVTDELVRRHGAETVDAATSGVYRHSQGTWQDAYARVTTEDLTSSRLFAQADHQPINEALYGGHQEALAPYTEQVRSHDTVLEELPSYAGPVHRTVDLDPTQQARYRPGEVVWEPGYVIASGNPHGQFHGNTEFVIESRTGRLVGPGITEHIADHEVHFRRDTPFEVTSVEPLGGGHTRIHLRELADSAEPPGQAKHEEHPAGATHPADLRRSDPAPGDHPVPAEHPGHADDSAPAGGADPLHGLPDHQREAVERLLTDDGVRRMNDGLRSDDPHTRAEAQAWAQNVAEGLGALPVADRTTVYHYTSLSAEHLAELVPGAGVTMHGVLDGRSVHAPDHGQPVELIVHSRTGADVSAITGRDRVVFGPEARFQVLAREHTEHGGTHRIFLAELPRDGSPLPGTAPHPETAAMTPRPMDERLQNVFDTARAETEAGVAYFHPDDPRSAAMLDSARRATPVEGAFSFDLHAGPSHARAGSERLDGRDVATLLSHEPALAAADGSGRPPVLRSLGCRTGRGEHPIAQDIANETGRIVIAPDDEVWVDANGHAQVSAPSIGPDGRPRPLRIPPEGSWRIFVPEDHPTTPASHRDLGETRDAGTARDTSHQESPPPPDLTPVHPHELRRSADDPAFSEWGDRAEAIRRALPPDDVPHGGRIMDMAASREEFGPVFDRAANLNLDPATHRWLTSVLEFNHEPTGIRAEIAEISYGGRDFNFMFRFVGPDGREVGFADIYTFTGLPGYEGVLAHYGNIGLYSTDHQGHGFGAELQDRLENWFISQGIDVITLNAGGATGTYAWARSGFTFADRSAFEGVVDRFRQNAGTMSEAGRRDWAALESRLTPEAFDGGYGVTAYELGRIGWEDRRIDPDGRLTWDGKEILLHGPAWKGHKYLLPPEDGGGIPVRPEGPDDGGGVPATPKGPDDEGGPGGHERQPADRTDTAAAHPEASTSPDSRQGAPDGRAPFEEWGDRAEAIRRTLPPDGLPHDGNIRDIIVATDGVQPVHPAVRQWIDSALGFEHPQSGLRLSIDEAAVFDEGVLLLHGEFTDAYGDRQGEMVLNVHADDQDAHLEIGLVELYDDYQGRGIGVELMDRVENWAIGQGINDLRLWANIDIGGYAWTLYGFDFDIRYPYGVSGLPDIVHIVESIVRSGHLSPEGLRDWEAMAPRATREAWYTPDRVTAYEISRIGWEARRLDADGRMTWDGKEILRNSGWQGVRFLEPPNAPHGPADPRDTGGPVPPREPDGRPEVTEDAVPSGVRPDTPPGTHAADPTDTTPADHLAAPVAGDHSPGTARDHAPFAEWGDRAGAIEAALPTPDELPAGQTLKDVLDNGALNSPREGFDSWLDRVVGFEHSSSGVRVELETWTLSPDALKLEVHLYHGDDQVGFGENFVRLSSDNELVASFDMLYFGDPNFQSHGLGSAWIDHLEHWYISQGVKEIRLLANIDVGGYAWSRSFDFSEQPGKSRFGTPTYGDPPITWETSEFKKLVGWVEGHITDGRMSESGLADWAHLRERATQDAWEQGYRLTPAEFSRIGWDARTVDADGRMMWDGKRILLEFGKDVREGGGGGWHGVRHLVPSEDPSPPPPADASRGVSGEPAPPPPAHGPADPGALPTVESGPHGPGLTGLGPEFHSTAQDHQALRDLLGEERYRSRLYYADMSAEMDRNGGGWAGELYSLPPEDRAAVYARIPEADRVALYDYTGSAFDKINEALRSGDPAALAHYAPQIRCILSALNHLPVHEGPVDRNVYAASDELPGLLARYERGAVVSEDAFLSTSPDPEGLQGGNVRFTIESRTGREILPGLTADPSEREILFPPGSRFEVTNVERTAEGARIRLRQLPAEGGAPLRL